MKKQKKPDINSLSVVIDVSEVANFIDVSVDKVYELIDQGKLKNCPDHKKKARVTRISLKKYLEL